MNNTAGGNFINFKGKTLCKYEYDFYDLEKEALCIWNIEMGLIIAHNILLKTCHQRGNSGIYWATPFKIRTPFAEDFGKVS